MADVTNELLYGVLKSIPARMDKLDIGLSDLRSEMITTRGAIVTVQQDVHHIYSRLAHMDKRLDHIEKRLELRELAEAQARFEPHP
ncbi:hypothetical protein GB928_002365 [Shinella curvata]|uniref:Uncharacterized protein n=1 Tax=Shinella curvata TaxID=1817964 RepID=A0ABT8X8U5_9HYPH|nr:hypothetical protein [Shinella curvata]MCJ8052029.1 hypothetical protein [Shinella curvata]MDO6120023.1 hypothetical protein [Shinella curvata]